MNMPYYIQYIQHWEYTYSGVCSNGIGNLSYISTSNFTYCTDGIDAADTLCQESIGCLKNKVNLQQTPLRTGKLADAGNIHLAIYRLSSKLMGIFDQVMKTWLTVYRCCGFVLHLFHRKWDKLQLSGKYLFFLSLKHFIRFLLRHFGHWNISVICLAVVLKLAITVFFSLYLQTFWPKWLNFFQSFQKRFGLWLKNDQRNRENTHIFWTENILQFVHRKNLLLNLLKSTVGHCLPILKVLMTMCWFQWCGLLQPSEHRLQLKH